MSRRVAIHVYSMTAEQLVEHAKEKYGLELVVEAGQKTLLSVIQDHKDGLDKAEEGARETAKAARKARTSKGVPSGANQAISAKMNQELNEAATIARVQAAMPPELKQEVVAPVMVRKTYRVGMPAASAVLTDANGHPLLPDSDPVLPEELAFADITNLVDEDEERKMQEKLAAFPQLRGKVGGLRSQTASEKPFRHPQHTRFLFHPRTKVYWPPTETLMRRDDMIPIFEDTLPPDAVMGA